MGLGLDAEKDNLPHQMDRDEWPNMKKRFADIFKTKTRDEWVSELSLHINPNTALG